ncbi:MAG TPA: 23S rRNA (guanosine(2251)-2'-O)-methyltransferase RlmB [Chloroflexota bacterium]|nr:23S rRNA (guanosine(2251)-2'-O)-methyltransferase RlmB [Chloroflexota bacterium]
MKPHLRGLADASPAGLCGSLTIEFLYGRNSVLEALRAGRGMRRILVADSAHGLDALIAEARRRRVPLDVLPRRALDDRAGDHHQGVLAEAEPFTYTPLDEILARAEQRQEPPFLLALDSLQDPQNFGTLLRTAQACGIHGVILPEHRAVGVTPAVSNASAGAVEHLAVARVTNLSRSLRWLKERGVWVYGLAVEGAQPFTTTNLNGPLALVVGSEGSGLGRLVSETCDALIAIPMANSAIQSLNASVAGSVVLYDAFRQRQS